MASASDEVYRVLFAENLGADGGPRTIVIAPHSDSWNDFGFRTRVDVLVRPGIGHPRQHAPLRLPAHLGLLKLREGDQAALALEKMPLASKGVLPAGDDAPEFFTMLPEIATYREIVSALGTEEARLVLIAMRDVVEAEDAPAGRPWLRRAIESRVFRLAFLRTTESFFAWKYAAMVLNGLEFEEVGRISDELKIEFQLAGRPNSHRLSFRFALHDEVLPKRFAVIIGKNGVGKSQTLGRIALAAIHGLPSLTDGDGGRPLFNRILAFRPATAGAEVFPGDRRKRSMVWYRRFLLGASGRALRGETTADLIVQLARSPELIRDARRFEIFRRTIQAIEEHAELALVPQRSGEELVHLDQLLRGGEQALLERFAGIDFKREVVRVIDGKAYPLSSGELSFVRFAALAALHIENSSLLLFDEPETHLHPDFISRFVALLDNLLTQTGSAAIIATHSVYFVREAFEDQVTVLRSDPNDRSIRVEPPRLRTFGADVGAISYFVFGEDEPSRLARAVEERITARSNTWEEAFAAYKDDLSLDLLGEIRAAIEDRKRTATSK